MQFSGSAFAHREFNVDSDLDYYLRRNTRAAAAWSLDASIYESYNAVGVLGTVLGSYFDEFEECLDNWSVRRTLRHHEIWKTMSEWECWK